MAKITPLTNTEVKNALSNPKVKKEKVDGKVYKMRDGE